MSVMAIFQQLCLCHGDLALTTGVVLNLRLHSQLDRDVVSRLLPYDFWPTPSTVTPNTATRLFMANRSSSSLVIVVGVLSLASASAQAQSPAPGSYSAAKYELTERRGVMVAVRDRVRLSSDIYAPTISQKLPSLLSILPYDKSNFRKNARWFAQRGYVVVVVDTRGRFNSEGTFDLFDPKHKTDGYDLVEWIARQPWSNGKVGMIGGSYSGWEQWWTATEVPTHLTAIAPLSNLAISTSMPASLK